MALARVNTTKYLMSKRLIPECKRRLTVHDSLLFDMVASEVYTICRGLKEALIDDVYAGLYKMNSELTPKSLELLWLDVEFKKGSNWHDMEVFNV